MRGLRVAVGLLTRVPVAPVDGAGIGPGVPWFSFVGSLIGLVAGGVYGLAYGYMPSPLAATLALASGIVITGGLHEDGLADTADALGPGLDRVGALDVMRDSRVGAFGVLALATSVVWRVLALGSLSPGLAVAALVSAHAMSRGAVALVGSVAHPARPEGLGHEMALQAKPVQGLIAAGAGVAIAGLALGWWVVYAVVVVAVFTVFILLIGLRRLGGFTGDLLGAVQQLAEMGVIGVVASVAWQGAPLWWS